MLHAFIFAAIAASPLRAEQTSWEVDRDAQRWAFDLRWHDAEGAEHRARFELPTAPVKADLQEPLRFRVQEANQHVAGEVRAWAADRNGPEITVRASGGGVRISASGRSRSRVQQALADAAEVRDQAAADYQREHGFTTIGGAIAPDHIRHVREYADEMAPVVEALGGPGEDPRSFATLALGFVQSIPYERASAQRDRYRRPMSLLGRNKGDCDSKSTLFLALVHQAWPELPLAMIYIPGHVYVGLDLEPMKGESFLQSDQGVWLLAEPVGPALRPLGEVDRKSRRRARRGKVELRALEERS